MSPATTPVDTAQDRDAFSVDEAAVRLSVSPDAIRDAIDRGQIRAVRLGRRVLVPRDAVREFLAPVSSHTVPMM